MSSKETPALDLLDILVLKERKLHEERLLPPRVSARDTDDKLGMVAVRQAFFCRRAGKSRNVAKITFQRFWNCSVIP